MTSPLSTVFLVAALCAAILGSVGIAAATLIVAFAIELALFFIRGTSRGFG